DVGPTLPFVLDSLPDSFRYDRRVSAYGINGGVTRRGENVFSTTDYACFDKRRPDYWDAQGAGPKPDLSIRRLAENPVGPVRELATRLREWSQATWSEDALRGRASHEGWDDQMLDQARRESRYAQDEVDRIERGVELLARDDRLRRAFTLANR